MTLLSAHRLEKSYGNKRILDGVSLSIEPRDRIGLIGRNGAGKSTLVRILGGREEAESGQIIRRRGLSVGMVDQVPTFRLDETVGEALRRGIARHQEIEGALAELEAKMGAASQAELTEMVELQAELTGELERLGGWNMEHRADAMADALQVPPKDRLVRSLSLGEQRRLALAVGLLEGPALLILDEPTNHLDADTVEWLQGALAEYPGALLLVTHDRYFLDEVAKKIAEIDRGELRMYEGNYTEYMVRKAERESIEARTEHNRLRAIENELVWVQASAPARTTKQKARLDRFFELVANRPKQQAGDVYFRLPHPPRIGKTILELKDLSKAWGEKVLIEALTLTLKKGDRIGIVGPNGAGKSTLVKMILGEVEADRGEIVQGANTAIVYADQARADLDEGRTVLEEVAGEGDKVWVGDHAVQVQTFLSQLLFDDGLMRTKVGALSGGEKSRVSLAKSLRVAGNLLILDEPTNDLDLATLRVLEDALVEYPGCALIISHDRYFLDRVATAILAFEGGGRVVLYEGSYGFYRERARQAPAAPATKEPAKERRTEGRAADAPPKRRKRSFPEQREFEGMEAKILEAEEAVGRRQAELADPAKIKALGAKLPEEMAALEAARAEVERLYGRWSELSELEAYG